MKIYRLFDYETGHYVGGEFFDASKFFEYHYHNTFNAPVHAIRSSLIGQSCPPFSDEYNYHIFGRYQIKNELGGTYETPIDIWNEAVAMGVSFLIYRDWNSYYSNWVYPWERKLAPPNNNLNKLKHQFYQIKYYRPVRVKQELTANDNDCYGCVRGKRRNLHLHYRSKYQTIKDSNKSWKHNSRRKHQWKEIIDKK